MKKFITLIIALFAVLPAFACAKTDPTVVNVYMPDGATAVSMAYMMQNVRTINGKNIKYTVVPASFIGSMVLADQPGIAVMPINVTPNVAGYSLAAITSHGNLYIMTSEDNLTLNDLQGKKISAFGDGQIPGLILKYILQANGITATIEFKNAASEVAVLLNGNLTSCGMLPEPAVSTVLNKPGSTIKIGIDLQEEYRKILAAEGDENAVSGFPQSGLIVNNTLDKLFVNEFLRILVEYKNFAVDHATEIPAIIAANMMKDTETDIKSLTADTVTRCKAYAVTTNLQPTISDYFMRIGVTVPPATFFYAGLN